jgi:hypothetical protein
MTSAEPWNLDVSPTIHRKFNRLKDQGLFSNDQDLMQAALNALDECLERNSQSGTFNPMRDLYSSEPYMRHPGLSLDDYDL